MAPCYPAITPVGGLCKVFWNHAQFPQSCLGEYLGPLLPSDVDDASGHLPIAFQVGQNGTYHVQVTVSGPLMVWLV